MIRRLAPALVVFALVVSACVPSTLGPSPTLPPVTVSEAPAVTTTTTPSVEVAVARFRDCLASQGLEIEEIPLDALGRPRFDLVFAGIDFSNRQHVEALAACRDHVVGGPLDLSNTPELREEVMGRLGAFASCVRERGVEDFPDPAPDYDGSGSPFPTIEIPYEDPDLVSAVVICRTRIADR